MWIYILIAVVMIIILVAYFSLRKGTSASPKSRNNPSTYKPRRIEDCISAEDMQYQMSYETQRVIDSVEASKTAIKDAMAVANSTVSTAWLNSYEKVIKISANLDENLKFYAQKNLEHSKFQYYASLHFRSMIAADIVHKEFSEIDASFNDINNLIVTIAKTGKTTRMSKSQIYAAKDALKELRKVFLNRVQEMNHKTATLRDKIGRECGERGKQWRVERMRNRV